VGGLDIRDNSGQSVGSRKPIASGSTKNETLPISSIGFTMSEAQPELNQFLKHWEDMTGATATFGGQHVDYSNADPFFPQSFFQESRSRQAVPFSSKSLRAEDYTGHLNNVQKILLVNTGDLLWLFDRFFEIHYHKGSEIDMASSSEHPQSVYRALSGFCSQCLYKTYPHIQILKVFVDIAETVQTEQLIASNALDFACDIYFPAIRKRYMYSTLPWPTGRQAL
jgi:hypothetical protein